MGHCDIQSDRAARSMINERVPMLGYADSLNVSVSASVLLYEARAHKDGW